MGAIKLSPKIPNGAQRGVALLLFGGQLEVLGREFDPQGVGAQRVDHVLVALAAVLEQEGAPVGLRGTH